MDNKTQTTNSASSDTIIELDHLTKDYGGGRGIFDITFSVKKGEVFGYCGTNGAGKTTTLRQIMGFIKPDMGEVKVMGLSPWKNGEKIKEHIGYLPGEIAFPPVENGSEFLKIQADMIGLKDMSKAEKIINMMQLDPTANLKRMSKGMKQKTAIVSAFMHSPDIIILDEPTTGLDPLMREAFISLIKEEKERGATIIMSNHMFDELEETCDRVGFIKEGHLLEIVDMKDIHKRSFREYVVRFFTEEEYNSFNLDCCEVVRKIDNIFVYIIRVNVSDTEKMLNGLSKYNLRTLNENRYSLEQYFMENIGGKENVKFGNRTKYNDGKKA